MIWSAFLVFFVLWHPSDEPMTINVGFRRVASSLRKSVVQQLLLLQACCVSLGVVLERARATPRA